MSWCEVNRVGYLLGLARNVRLVRAIGAQLYEAYEEHHRTGRPARRFRDYAYRTRKSWSRSQRVVGKAGAGLDSCEALTLRGRVSTAVLKQNSGAVVIVSGNPEEAH